MRPRQFAGAGGFIQILRGDPIRHDADLGQQGKPPWARGRQYQREMWRRQGGCDLT
jgi:hypothetical protein